MGFVGSLHKPNGLILPVVLLQVQQELLCVARVDGCRYPISPLGQQQEHSFVNKVVNEDDALLGTTNQLRHIAPGIPHATCGEDLLWSDGRSKLVHTLQHLFHLLVGQHLMTLQPLYTLKHTGIGREEATHGYEGTHDADIHLYSIFTPQDTRQLGDTLLSKDKRKIL